MPATKSSEFTHAFRDLCEAESATGLKKLLPPAKAASLPPSTVRLLLQTAVITGSFEGLNILEPILTPKLLSPPRDSYLTMALIHCAKRELIGTAPAGDEASRDEKLADFVIKLIKLGAPPSGFKSQRLSPLGCALRRGIFVIETLIHQGAVPTDDDFLRSIDLNRPDALSLMLAIKNPGPMFLEKLAERAKTEAGDCHGAIVAFQERRELAGMAGSSDMALAAPRRM